MSVINQIKTNLKNAGIIPQNSSTKKEVGTISTAWESDGQIGTFFKPIAIEGNRWSKLFPYRILVVQQTPDGNYSIYSNGSSSPSAQISTENSNSQSASSNDRFSITFSPSTSSWEYSLPITPQQLSITNPFAINSYSTLRGYGEEHSGTKFKMINCAGSFGTWSTRRSISDPPAQNISIVESLFAGTLQAVEGVTNQISRLSNILKGGKHPATKPNPVNEENSVGSYEGTGYVQALLLDQFLEQYAELKRTAKGANLRLAFDMPKQNQTYLVTPMQFTYSQSIDSPNEYKFNLQFKAFRRVVLQKGAQAEKFNVSPLSTDVLNSVLTAITEARRTLASSVNLVKSVRSDFRTPFNAMREVSVFIKDLTGLALSVVDLPENIISDANMTIADTLANLSQAEFQARAVDEKIKKQIDLIKKFKEEREGQILGNFTPNKNTKTSPINNLFQNPIENFELFDAVKIQEVNFPLQTRNAINNETARVSLLTVDDIIKHKNTIQELAYQISNAFGTGDETFSAIYKRSAPKDRLQDITIDEYDILKKLYDVIQLLGVMTLNDDLNQNQNAAYEFVKAEAQDAGIPFEDSDTKIRVPVPFGLNIEQIAIRYLGDQERWIEIATINALKSPYIDEDGFSRTFLSNGDGRQFNVNSNENLFIGQKIILISDLQPRQRRTIIDIEKINDTNYLVTVDGLDNLEIFTTAQNAKLIGYLPGTVNSQNQIFVPSTLDVTDDLITRPIPSTQDDALTGLSRVDLLLTTEGDIAVNSYGDFRLAYGLTNLFQALKMKFITEQGQLIRHPGYGANLTPGMSTAETTASEIYNTISALIAQDSRFAGIQTLKVNIDGPFIDVSLSVFVANGLGVFPLSFRLAG